MLRCGCPVRMYVPPSHIMSENAGCGCNDSNVTHSIISSEKIVALTGGTPTYSDG